MKNLCHKITVCFLTGALVLTAVSSAVALDVPPLPSAVPINAVAAQPVSAVQPLKPTVLSSALAETGKLLYQTVSAPQVGSIGGEWAVFALARWSDTVPQEYYQKYYQTVEQYVQACQGVLHEKKYTEYSRVILALTALGKDPAHVGGYNLLAPLADYEKVIGQGLNGAIWALLALDSGNYAIPANSGVKTLATRELYLKRILDSQLTDGGFSLNGQGSADPDITAMALQALAKYQDLPLVKKATDKALACLAEIQDNKGGYASYQGANSTSVIQVIVALTELGIAVDDPRFVKDGNTLMANLMTYYQPGGGFRQTLDSSSLNQMATEQGFYALVAVNRALNGQPSLYRMTDSLHIADGNPSTAVGLPGKHADIKINPVAAEGKTFGDIAQHPQQAAIEALAGRQIINGVGDKMFAPTSPMTRAEFAAMMVKGLGLPLQTGNTFQDIAAKDWCCGYVNTAYHYGIVKGVAVGQFDPNSTITREEVAVMMARAAQLCGMKTDLTTMEIRDTLAGFTDYVQAAAWSQSALAFCSQTNLYHNILAADEMKIMPQAVISRAEVAQMLLNLLTAAKLL